MKQEKPPIWFGFIFVAAGILPMAMGAEPTSGTPAWMVPMACSVFILGGICAIGMSLNFPQISHICGPLIILIMATMFTYIGFGPGERQCSSSTSFLFLTKTKSSGCGAFGFFGIFTFLIFLGVLCANIKKFFRK